MTDGSVMPKPRRTGRRTLREAREVFSPMGHRPSVGSSLTSVDYVLKPSCLAGCNSGSVLSAWRAGLVAEMNSNFERNSC
jgi:hypothetical protein